MPNFGNKNDAARSVYQIILLEKLTRNPIIQLIDSLVRARIVKIFLESNPSLKIFSWLRMNKIGRDGAAMFQTDLQVRLGKFYQLR